MQVLYRSRPIFWETRDNHSDFYFWQNPWPKWDNFYWRSFIHDPTLWSRDNLLKSGRIWYRTCLGTRKCLDNLGWDHKHLLWNKWLLNWVWSLSIVSIRRSNSLRSDNFIDLYFRISWNRVHRWVCRGYYSGNGSDIYNSRSCIRNVVLICQRHNRWRLDTCYSNQLYWVWIRGVSVKFLSSIGVWIHILYIW